MGIIIVYTFELHIVQGDISGARPGEEREKVVEIVYHLSFIV